MDARIRKSGVVIGIALLFAVSGNFTLAKDKGQHGAPSGSPLSVSAPPPAAGVPNHYSATPPHHIGAPAHQPPSHRLEGTAHSPATRRELPRTTAVPRQDAHPLPVKPARPGAVSQGQAVERTIHWSHDEHSGKSRLDPQSAAHLRAWRGKPDGFGDAAFKHGEHCKHHHDREWWRHHCRVIVLVDWGYWGWDAGWWYPAWGYDPYYASYEFNGPIYGYDALPPDQIIANVQGALQELGYYLGLIDGVLGPSTQEALQNYQRDQGLPVTGTIDPETLKSLGFT